MKPLEWSLWLCSALVFAASGPRAELPLHALESTEGVASALHAAPVTAAQASPARSALHWSGAGTTVGTPLSAVRAVQEGLALRIASAAAAGDGPDIPHIALGFLPERSLAPPRLG
jgi:hypothetical protein